MRGEGLKVRVTDETGQIVYEAPPELPGPVPATTAGCRAQAELEEAIAAAPQHQVTVPLLALSADTALIGSPGFQPRARYPEWPSFHRPDIGVRDTWLPRATSRASCGDDPLPSALSPLRMSRRQKQNTFPLQFS